MGCFGSYQRIVDNRSIEERERDSMKARRSYRRGLSARNKALVLKSSKSECKK